MTIDASRPGAPRVETVPLAAEGDRPAQTLTFLRFGEPGARPKAYVQASLHADELPGLFVARLLTGLLTEAAAAGRLRGEIVLAPVANPVGLTQLEGGYMQGRVERASGRNFNRGFPDLAAAVAPRLAGRLGDDAAANVALIRAEMTEALDALRPADAFETLQRALLARACDADFVLDLHADNEALAHIYVGAPSWPDAADLAAEIDARAVLLCGDSGGAPFDESCGEPWRKLAEGNPGAAIPQACLSATLELRSNNAVDRTLAERDARALYRFFTRRGLIDGDAGARPRLLADATPLAAMRRLEAPIEGLIDYRLRLGDTVRAGEAIAHIVPPFGEPVAIAAPIDGLLFARHDQPWAWPGKTIGKVAGRGEAPGETRDALTD